MKDRYRLYQRENRVYYCQENGTVKQGSLRTKDRREAQKLVNAKNESHRKPTLNLSIARAYLAAHDPGMSKRTWREVMHEMERHGTRGIDEGIEAAKLRDDASNCGEGFARRCDTSWPTLRDMRAVGTEHWRHPLYPSISAPILVAQ